MVNCIDSQVVPVRCPFCGQGGHVVFGQSVASGFLRWYLSISCPTSGNTEEDGLGSGPNDLRMQLLNSKGVWSVYVDRGERAKSVLTAKRLFSLSNDDAAFLLQSYPCLRVGTNAEADWLVRNLADEGILGKIMSPRESDS